MFLVLITLTLGVEKKARQWCAHKGNICYYETTAKEDYNVDELF